MFISWYQGPDIAYIAIAMPHKSSNHSGNIGASLLLLYHMFVAADMTYLYLWKLGQPNIQGKQYLLSNKNIICTVKSNIFGTSAKRNDKLINVLIAIAISSYDVIHWLDCSYFDTLIPNKIRKCSTMKWISLQVSH